MSNSNKKEKIIELFEESSLPKKGWIQACINCLIKTSGKREFKRVNTTKIIFILQIYLCKTCIKKNIITNPDFIEHIEKFINEHYLFPC